jgi:hypothetical protein
VISRPARYLETFYMMMKRRISARATANEAERQRYALQCRLAAELRACVMPRDRERFNELRQQWVEVFNAGPGEFRFEHDKASGNLVLMVPDDDPPRGPVDRLRAKAKVDRRAEEIRAYTLGLDASHSRKQIRRRDKTKAGMAEQAAVEAAREDRKAFRAKVRAADRAVGEAFAADRGTSFYVGIPPRWPMQWVAGVYVPRRNEGKRKRSLPNMGQQEQKVGRKERHNTPFEQRELEMNVAAKKARSAGGRGRPGEKKAARYWRAYEAEMGRAEKEGKK